MKILSPAGNFESLKMAVYNGADEVYLGINDFNARNNIDGFNMQNLKEAVDFAHVYGVKVDLAINILFNDEELQQALDIIVDAYNMGIDAFIIQDLGLANIVHTNYPQIELHASTQMGIHNLEGVKYIERFGFKRVVLARETPLEEIKRINENSNIEIEYFAQGALCVSFSGNCYLSSALFNASGNRGKCKQLCRLPFSLLKDGQVLKNGYLLSAKDFNMIDRLADLKKVGVDVLKIEGRARRPFYVAMATREYHNAINKIKYNIENLQLAFNREYTTGYFDGNGKIISNIQNHIGIKIGKILDVKYGKKFNEVFFSSNRKLFPKSTFKTISNGKEKATLTAFDLKEFEKNKYVLTTTQKIDKNDDMHLIVDAELEKQALTMTRKKQIEIDLTFETNKPMLALIKFNDNAIKVSGEICETAKNQPLTKSDIENNFKKSELFDACLNIEKIDNVFIPKQKLNDFRRKVFDSVFEYLTKQYEHNLNKTSVSNSYEVHTLKDYQIIENANEKLTSKNIIFSPCEYKLEEIKLLQEKCKKTKITLFLDTPNFAMQKDIEIIAEIIEKTHLPIVANNYYALSFKTENLIGAGLNVYNLSTAQLFNKTIMSAESSIASKLDFPYMTFRHCPFKNHLNANCSKCPYKDGYQYKMENGKIFNLKRKKLSTCTFYLTK